jgi:hypothetical protein
MAKLRLEVEELVVESFTPATVHTETGTVRARQSGPYTDECDTCGADSQCGPCDTPNCTHGCNWTQTCDGYQTCAGAYTCGGVDTCVWPDCTAYGAIC